MKSPLAMRDGVSASTILLPDGVWPDLLSFLVQHFAEIGRDAWLSRFARALVLDAQGRALHADAPYVPGTSVHYYRELPPETPVPFEAEILHQDAHLLVVDKPHFLTVLPSGRYLQETLLVRLKKQLGIETLSPLHRIDRGTAGIVLLSTQPATRGAYQNLFAQRRVLKTYEALAPALPALSFPLVHRSRMVEGEPFFRMQEVPGEPNSETQIDILERRGAFNLYRLHPLTGRRHQLRVHLASLGAPIVNDPLYPELYWPADDDYSRPLQLLARGIAFDDPLSGARRTFISRRSLCLDTPR